MAYNSDMINKVYYDYRDSSINIIVGYDKAVDRYITRNINMILGIYTSISMKELESMIFSIDDYDNYADRYYNNAKIQIDLYNNYNLENNRLLRKSIDSIISCYKTLKTGKLTEYEYRKNEKGIRRRCKRLYRYMSQHTIDTLLEYFKENYNVCNTYMMEAFAKKYDIIKNDRAIVTEYLSNEKYEAPNFLKEAIKALKES
jgi:hypothetical protein